MSTYEKMDTYYRFWTDRYWRGLRKSGRLPGAADTFANPRSITNTASHAAFEALLLREYFGKESAEDS